MDRLGIQSLNAGASDLRLTGDQTQRGGTYTQRRRTQMAGGGIANIRQIGKPGGLVEPGISKYAWYDFIVDPVKDFVQEKALPFVVDKGGEFLSDLLGGGKDQPQPMPDYGPYSRTPPYVPQSTQDPGFWTKLGQTIVPGGETGFYDLYGTGAKADTDIGTPPYFPSGVPHGPDFEMGTGGKDQDVPWYLKLGQTIMPGGEPGYIDLYSGTGEKGEGPSIFRQAANIGVPLGIGKWAHDYQKDYLAKQPKFPGDETKIDFKTAQEYMDDPTQRFKPKAAYADLAEGGRIGYSLGKSVEKQKQKDIFKSFAEYKSGGGRKQFASWYNDVWLSGSGAGMPEIPQTYMASAQDDWPENMPEITIRKPIPTVDGEPIDIEDWKYMAQGGRIGYRHGSRGISGLPAFIKEYVEHLKAKQEKKRLSAEEQELRTTGIGAAEGGLMNLGGME